MPTKSKIRSINVSKKWNTWYIKSESKTSIVLSYCKIIFHIISLSICQLYYFIQEIPRLNPEVLKHTTSCQDLQNTTHCQHQIPHSHIRLDKACSSLWKNRNHLTLTFHLALLKPQHPHTPILGTTEEGQLHQQLIIFLSIIIISGLWNIHVKHLLVVQSRGLSTQEEM